MTDIIRDDCQGEDDLTIARMDGFRRGKEAAAAEIAALRARIREAHQIIFATPVVRMNRENAAMNGEAHAIEYADRLEQWSPRARAFLNGGKS